jgi:glycine/D-amino acid oxidase-like deaminating enzyme
MPTRSYWEHDALTRYDHLVVGAGIVGLSTALALAETRRGARIGVLERGLRPSGATTRNAGFACFGSPSEILADIEQLGPERALGLVRKRVDGLARLRRRVPDEAIGYVACGGFELLDERGAAVLAQLEALNRRLAPIFGGAPFRSAPERLAEFGFAPRAARDLIESPAEGQLHSGELAAALLSACRWSGIEVLTGAQVLALDERADRVVLQVADPALEDPLELSADSVAVCSNAWIGKLCPSLEVRPGRGQVLLSAPVPGLPFRGVFHAEQGYWYFRNVGERVLYGGGRNLDFEGETTHALELSPRIQAELERRLREEILPGRDVRIDQRWSGIMGFGPEKEPRVERVSDRIAVGFACNGMGVALGTWAGDEVARVLLER